MSHVTDFADLFNMEDLQTFDKADDYQSPNLSPTRPAGIASSSPPAAKNANFLVKLYMALQEEPPSTAIYWSVDGKQLVVACPAQLEKEILPKYWKHNKFASFGRQLNIYGFSRVYPGRIFKDENGNVRDDASVWSHPVLHRESTLEQLTAIKRRAAPKLFRTRKLANGQIVQIRAGAQADAKMNSLRVGRQDSFSRKAPEPYHLSPYHMVQQTPTFYHSGGGRYAQEISGSPQWAFGSYASPAVEPAQLFSPRQQGHVTGSNPTRYVSQTVLESLRDPPHHNDPRLQTPISPMDIIRSIPDATPQFAPASQGWWMYADLQPPMHSLDVQGNQTQGMPPLSWTTPSSPTNVLPFRDRWNSSSSQTLRGHTGVFRHDLAHSREVFCTAPASPLHAGNALQMREDPNVGTGYPATPQDVKIAPADFQFNKNPQEQTYFFSQEEHAVPFSAVETSFLSFEHTDTAVPATADVYLGSQRRPDTGQPSYQDIWPVNVMSNMTTKPLPMPSNSPEVYGLDDRLGVLPYAKTYRYTVPSAPPGIYLNGQGM